MSKESKPKCSELYKVLQSLPEGERQAVEVPEIVLDGDMPFVVYFRELTLQETKACMAKADGDNQELLCYVFMEKAEREDGQKWANVLDKTYLMNKIGRSLIQNIAEKIIDYNRFTVKNL